MNVKMVIESLKGISKNSLSTTRLAIDSRAEYGDNTNHFALSNVRRCVKQAPQVSLLFNRARSN